MRLLDILQINAIVINFAYGLVFFSVGLAIELKSHESRRRSSLAIAPHLGWLAGFGFLHGLHEWGNVFIPIQADYLAPSAVLALLVVHSGLLALSFVLLIQFGILITIPASGWRTAIRLAPLGLLGAGGILLVATGGHLDVPGLGLVDLWIRRLLAPPGALLAGFGLLRQAARVKGFGPRRISRHFRLAAVSMGAYSVLAGLGFPQANSLAVQWSSHQLGADLFGLPIIMLRSLAGLGIAVGIGLGLNVFEVETERLLKEAEQRRFDAAERARLALDAMANTVSRRLELGALLDAALARVLEVSQSPAGWVMLGDPATGRLTVHAFSGPAGSLMIGTGCDPRPECVCAIALGGTLAGPGVAEACRVVGGDPTLHDLIGVPLQAGDQPVGVLCLATPGSGGFQPEDLGLLTSIGRQIGLAVENARLWQELRRKEAIRTRLLKRTITAQEEERRRVARELHDETGQNLTAVIMGLGAAREAVTRDPARAGEIMDETRLLAVGALHGVRELILGLRPASLDDLGLVAALRRLADSLHTRAGCEVTIDAGNLTRRLPPETETVFFRIVQEGFNNIARHAHAAHVSLQLTILDGEIRAVLEDDGVGFDPARLPASPDGQSGLGLLGMQERADLLEGDVVVESAPGRGTRLLIRLPIGPFSRGPAGEQAEGPLEEQADEVERQLTPGLQQAAGAETG